MLVHRDVLLGLVVDDNSDRLAFTQPQDWPGDTIAISPNRGGRPVREAECGLAPPLACSRELVKPSPISVDPP